MTELKIKPEVWNIPIGERDTIKTWIHGNPLGLTPDKLFSLGFRYKNIKRSFMFVSKVLGKHTPINPAILQDMTGSLAKVYFNDKTENRKIRCNKTTLIIGFAEAATGMAQIFFDSLEGDIAYVHSTRETPEGIDPIFKFKEAHSHAPYHNFYLLNEQLIKNAEEIILVDDEVTSGRTALGVIKTINSLYPGKKYGIASFLDWRDDENKKAFDQLSTEGIEIKCRSLLHGEIELHKVAIPENSEMPVYKELKNYHSENWNIYNLNYPEIQKIKSSYLRHSGRFGLGSGDRDLLDKLINNSVERIKTWLPEGRSLFLGTGEFLYIPFKLAEAAGGSVSFQSVTRTPNLPLIEKNYDIATMDVFPSPLNPKRDEYLYNLNAGDFDNIVLFLERRWPMNQLNPLLSVLEKKGYKSCSLVFFCE